MDGSRQVSDKEIWAVISKAKSDYIPYRSIFKKPFKNSVSKPKIPSEHRDHLVEKGKGIEEVDFWEASPERLSDSPAEDTVLLLQTFYKPEITYLSVLNTIQYKSSNRRSMDKCLYHPFNRILSMANCI